MALTAQKLFAAKSSDGASNWYQVQGGSGQEWHATVAGITAASILGGGTLRLEVSPDQTAIIAQIPITLTNPAAIQLPPGIWVRFTLTGSTAPNVDAWFCE